VSDSKFSLRRATRAATTPRVVQRVARDEPAFWYNVSRKRSTYRGGPETRTEMDGALRVCGNAYSLSRPESVYASPR
jgi:hypothetical protein